MKIKEVGIIGSGQMGNGIAHVCALSGYKVVLIDIAQDALDKAMGVINKNLSRQVQKGKITQEDMDSSLNRISISTDSSTLNNADLIIEAATENFDLKVKIFKGLLDHIKGDCLLSTNTSSMSITKLAAATNRPEKFIGLHFMNPVPVMKLVELIPGIATSDEMLETIKEFAQSLGKTVATSKDYPAFIANRILMPMINEAICALYEGVGDVESIDTAMKLGMGHPMGPLALADFIGLDTCLAIMNVLHEGFGNPKYSPSPLLVKYVEAGWYGVKSGKGFYDYPKK
ncbi:3-hydroxybutyryl-CoA dehydrogenase [Poseidonibacter lekithochrous]|uniref:3-hydroxybutyryl-CoA dehydrogenase n=1 Tax=Poseidonibacter lekithochrous TaxID=1904463 RepID=UPI0008FC78BF|nr:3-hydroxybutyryl-CoA dehydrogenase [Poseidonibacter lekithochrous]QKJ21389.1 3-hydroxybutyryl-CoA dehydrogenase [Poseidonibacter lekithochrous]